jgi:hypothetical protein
VADQVGDAQPSEGVGPASAADEPGVEVIVEQRQELATVGDDLLDERGLVEAAVADDEGELGDRRGLDFFEQPADPGRLDEAVDQDADPQRAAQRRAPVETGRRQTARPISSTAAGFSRLVMSPSSRPR